jgi:hypothetical protein
MKNIGDLTVIVTCRTLIETMSSSAANIYGLTFMCKTLHLTTLLIA